jgi:hypothetical protein
LKHVLVRWSKKGELQGAHFFVIVSVKRDREIRTSTTTYHEHKFDGKIVQGSRLRQRILKLTGLDPSPITSEAIEAAIKELPRDPETIALHKNLADHRPMPPR